MASRPSLASPPEGRASEAVAISSTRMPEQPESAFGNSRQKREAKSVRKRDTPSVRVDYEAREKQPPRVPAACRLARRPRDRLPVLLVGRRARNTVCACLRSAKYLRCTLAHFSLTSDLLFCSAFSLGCAHLRGERRSPRMHDYIDCIEHRAFTCMCDHVVAEVLG